MPFFLSSRMERMPLRQLLQLQPSMALRGIRTSVYITDTRSSDFRQGYANVPLNGYDLRHCIVYPDARLLEAL
jgi:hypothetical protein